MVSTEPIFISTPQFPEFFSPNSFCVWLIQAPPGGNVYLEFVEAFHYQCEDTCDKSFAEVHPGPDFRSTGYRFCCARLPTEQFTSATNEMLVFHNGWGDQSRGFKAKVWSNAASSLTTQLPQPLTTRKTTIATTVAATSEISKKITSKKYVPTAPPIPELFIISTNRRINTVESTTSLTTTTEATTTDVTTTELSTTLESTTIVITELPTETSTYSTSLPTTPGLFKPLTPIIPIAPIVPLTTDG